MIFCLILSGDITLAQRQQTAGNAPGAGTMPIESRRAMVQQYCSGCHNERTKSGGMTLTSLDLAHAEQNGELAEKVIRKLKVGLMPPPTARKPDAETVKAFVQALVTDLDRAAAVHPNPGRRPFQRLTRDEYARSVHDLLGIDVDVAKFLPPDSLSDGLDNIADSQTFSPALMTGYVRAAAQINREALGDPKTDATSSAYKLPRTASQMRHVEGAPMGTRGGISIVYNFPADGEYRFRSLLQGNSTGGLFGMVPNEELEVSIDGARVAVNTIDPDATEASPLGLGLPVARVFVKAGPRRVSAAFIQKHSEIVEDDIGETEHTLADTQVGRNPEFTNYPHLREFEISGPFNVTGVSDTPIRRRVFTCRPLSPSEEIPCATKIVTQLARQAFRRPLNTEDIEGLMASYDEGRKAGGDFESGIRMALEAVLVAPDFVFRFEQQPAGVKPGQNYRISDLELASRLSYFLWSTLPDDELMKLASQGTLKEPIVLEKQVRRMLNDPRSESLSKKFAGLWLHLPDLENLHPDAFYYPQYDQTLAIAMRQEIELLFDNIVREDRPVLELLTADYTFVNERLAKHYVIPNIRGSEFRRITLTDDYRRGLLGKGAILALTSVADRTSPVLRGKWVMGVLLGTPPPPPPPSVPKLDETPGTADGKSLTVRERMEMHRANPACNSCHQMIDPVGLALENFDVTGAWRTLDKTYSISPTGVRIHSPGVPIDPTSKLFDGTPLDGPASLRQAILKHSDAFIDTLTEKLMAYAVGRRMEHYDMPAIRAITRNAQKENNRFSSFILGIVKSPAFQMSRAEDPTATDSAANNSNSASQVTKTR
jgi:hypothetical protein